MTERQMRLWNVIKDYELRGMGTCFHLARAVFDLDRVEYENVCGYAVDTGRIADRLLSILHDEIMLSIVVYRRGSCFREKSLEQAELESYLFSCATMDCDT